MSIRHHHYYPQFATEGFRLKLNLFCLTQYIIQVKLRQIEQIGKYGKKDKKKRKEKNIINPNIANNSINYIIISILIRGDLHF